MTAGSFDPSILRVIIPQLGLILLGAVILVLDLTLAGREKTNPGLDRWCRISPDRCRNGDFCRSTRQRCTGFRGNAAL